MTLPAHQFGEGDQPTDADFEAFFERWFPSVLSYSRRFGAAHAEEVAQETLFRAFNCFSELRHDMPLPWLRTVARNVACDMHRAGTRLWPLPEPGDADPVDAAEGPEDSLLRVERVRHMRAALGDISADDRQLLHMLVVDENSVADVADQLSVTANTVRVRLHRARRRLGTHYLRRAGHQALALPALGLAALRRLLRPTTGTATRSVPALAAVAALGGLTAATVVLSQPTAPQHAWSAAATDQRAYSEPKPVAVSGKLVAATHTAFGTSSGRSARPVHPGGSTPAPIDAHVRLAPPNRPGAVTDTSITVQTPIGPVNFHTKTIRTPGESPVCRVTHQFC
jgi:RNA polymerase sigma-70 factor (ECF subfamily)